MRLIIPNGSPSLADRASVALEKTCSWKIKLYLTPCYLGPTTFAGIRTIRIRGEEIDYVVKNMERIREQLLFDTFKRMVACKILQEGILLSGSQPLFEEIRAMLVSGGVTEKLEEMEASSKSFRVRRYGKKRRRDSKKSERAKGNYP